MAITTDSILTALKNGSYTLSSITTDRFYKSKQPEKRRRYPSIELLETKPLSNTGTQESTDFTRVWEIRVFLRYRGGQTTAQGDEIDDLETLEDEVLDVIDGAQIGEDKIISEDKQWKRQDFNEQYPPYIMSVLTVTVRQITSVTTSADGTLKYDNSESTGDNKPGSDYTYTDVFNVDITETYRDHDEFTTQTANPARYAGGFDGTFIGHVKVSSGDLGSTDDKLNKLSRVRSNGEKPVVQFIYTNKDDTTPTASTITRTLKMTIESVSEVYRTKDNTVFRVLGRLLEPSTTTTS